MNVTPPTPPLPTPLTATPVPLANPVPLAAPRVSANPVTPGRRGDQSAPGRNRRERPSDPPPHPSQAVDIEV